VDAPGTAEGAEVEATGGRRVRELMASELEAACRTLAGAVVRRFEPEVVVGVVKGGVFAGEELASSLGCAFVPVRVHARSRDGGLPAEAGMPTSLAGKQVLIVDDIAGTGATLTAAVEAAKAAGAGTVHTATLVVREGGFQPDFHVLETDDLVVFPWDYEPTTGAVGSAGDDFQA
jgi:hypoxanthine phosphoribosyltransferase